MINIIIYLYVISNTNDTVKNIWLSIKIHLKYLLDDEFKQISCKTL